MPTISVIIPAYNAENTIKETINSVLKQTFTDFELLVINDGSQDSTLEVISSVSDSRIRVFSYSNAGVCAARNRGIAEATGEYLSFIDADDLWTPDKLEAQLAALQANPEAAVAYSWTDWIDESGQFLRPGSHIKSNGNVYSELLFRDFVASGSNPLIRKEALTQVGGFDESLTPAADWEMWLRLAAKYEFVNVPAAQILYRVSPNSMSANIWQMETESLEIIDRAFAQGSESLQNLKKQVLGERYKYLTLKAVEGKLERKRGLSAARFFWQAIRYDPSWLTRTKLMLILLLKIFLATVLPPEQARELLTKVQQFSKTNK
ncbi:MAG: glycosyltransferase [Symploca sp. SIO2E6]|nr:glycosyltransferase [Symploca sp. SIO2E6]